MSEFLIEFRAFFWFLSQRRQTKTYSCHLEEQAGKNLFYNFRLVSAKRPVCCVICLPICAGCRQVMASEGKERIRLISYKFPSNTKAASKSNRNLKVELFPQQSKMFHLISNL
ncbi:hypothetical protein CEXT_672081 [Caerostris extrusa]|uniref:Uncharacterized protein n=1 Tax=Caerostris extrusa TaxID=172846 RepID=A0AAV4RMR8_CAEEX|nr:hypothetical protein CEXT_672081 [Caerostris extrusa]